MKDLNDQEKEPLDDYDQEILKSMLYMGAVPGGPTVTVKQIQQFCEWRQSVAEGLRILEDLYDKKILARFIDGELRTHPMTKDGAWDDDLAYGEDEDEGEWRIS
jgi:hypothetical protein